MKQAHKKRPPRATANSPPGLPDMGGGIYFINLSTFYYPISNTLNETLPNSKKKVYNVLIFSAKL